MNLFQVQGQQDPVSWNLQFNKLAEDEVELVATATIDEGWYVYSQTLESDEGPIPTSINYEDSSQVAAWISNKESASQSSYKLQMIDEVFEMKLTKYKHDFTIRQVIKVADVNQEIAGFLEYMTCNATMCRPPTAVEFSFSAASLAGQNKIGVGEQEETNQAADNSENGPLAPVSWEINFKKISDTEVDLVATATIAEGWYVYSQTLESDDGPVKTSLNYEDSSQIVAWGPNEESASKAAYKLQSMDEVFEMKLTKYKHDFTITQRLTLQENATALTGFLEYMTCDATQCMPPTAVEFSYGTAANSGDNKATVNGSIFDPSRPQLIASMENIASEVDVVGMSLWTIFILGFGGGLLALLTPCVFPMIPMTVSLFSKGKKSKSEGIKNALTFGASIIVIYVALGLLITLAFGENALNLLSTHWLMNLIFFILFTVFAFSFFGYFEIQLPASWANKADQASMKGGLLGTFFGAFSIALVSFSCTGPIVGTLLVQAAVNGGVVGPTIGMLGFSVALALPFTLFAAFPSWLQTLPNSGSWMTSMKVVLGFLELALGLKFLSTADLTEHWGILPYELFVGLWALIFGAMTLYLFGLIRFPHDNPNATISKKRKGFGTFSAILTLSILSGFMTNPQTQAFKTPFWLSGLAPSACYSYVKPCYDASKDSNSTEESGYTYSDHCPPGIKNCFDDYDEALRYANEKNMPILVDFTGYGCVNCRKMEENVWIDQSVNKILNEDFVLVSLYVDDRKKLENVLNTPDGTKIRNVGNKWAQFQKVNFQKSSQPYYVLISPQEEVLNQPVGYTPDIKTYTSFLKTGLSMFKGNKAN